MHSEIPAKTDSSLRPRELTAFVGQESVRREIELMVKEERGEALGHILLIGPSGFGKETLACITANAIGANIKKTTGLTIETAGDLAGLLTSLENGDVLFIDQIDRLQPETLEYLYSPLRDFQLNIIIDEGPKARSLRLQLPKFTLVGASAHADKIDAQLLACFPKTLQFDRYTRKELQTILLRYGETIGVAIDQRAALEIAGHADGSPVVAKNLFRRVRDFSEVRDRGDITHSVAERALTVFLGEVNKGDYVQCSETVPSPPLQEDDHPRFAELDPEAPDRSFEALVCPSTLSEFVGQQTAREQLQIMIDAAKQRGDLFDHTLVAGGLGMGKTALAHVIANTMGVNIVAAEAANILDTPHLCRLMSSLERGDILLIEEIQGLHPTLEEDLRSAMENSYVDIILDDGPQARSLRTQFPKFTLIGTAPGEGMIGESLRSRFGAAFQLVSYSEAELLNAIMRSASVLGAAIDEREALEIVTRSDGSPRTANNLLRVAAPRLRILSAIERSAWDEIPNIIAKELWALAEARPDFEDLPTWIPQFEAATSSGEGSERARIAVERGRTMLRSIADHYSNEADRFAFAQMESKAFQERDSTSLAEFAVFLADAVQQAARFRKGVSRLPLAIDKDEILVGRHTRISFNRTLRIPEDGMEYPLPAGFGRLPIVRVEDYAERVPEAWLKEGGFIIPLYQREALFIEFSGVKWRPTIAKVALGRINAISGKEHDLKIRPHRQDYVVIPDQRWLDGINTGDGSVSQFVAMPLGKGFTIEAQVTDEERYGGFQLAVFDPKSGRFSEQDPKKKEAAALERKQRSLQAAQRELLDRLPAASSRVIRVVKSKHFREAAQILGISEADVLLIIENARLRFVEVLGEHGFDGIVPEEHLREAEQGPMFMPSYGSAVFSPSSPEQPKPKEVPQKSKPAVEMGIARGGTIKQQIFEDTYGAESWAESVFRDVVIHIVNSEVYQQITQCEAPPSPISIEQYQSYKIPWYSNYAEKAPSLSPVAALKRILGVEQIEKKRGVTEHKDGPKVEIQPDRLVHIRTPTVEERFRSLLDRAVQSSKNGRHRIAAREASLALDLSDQHPHPFLIRAVSNRHLGYYSDAEADASACLKLQPGNMQALSIRSYSLLALRETLLAKKDAETILASQPDHLDALYFRAEANLRLEHYSEAVRDAERMLRSDPANPEALRIRAEALTRLSDGQEPDEKKKPVAGANNGREGTGQAGAESTMLAASHPHLFLTTESTSDVTELKPSGFVGVTKPAAPKGSRVKATGGKSRGVLLVFAMIILAVVYRVETRRYSSNFSQTPTKEGNKYSSTAAMALPTLSPSDQLEAPLAINKPPPNSIQNVEVSTSPSIPTSNDMKAGENIDRLEARLTKNKERFERLGIWARNGVGPKERATYDTMLRQAQEEKADLDRQASGGRNETPLVEASLNALPGERFPQTRQRTIESSEVKTWTTAEIRYAINEMYARHGADFRDEQLRRYFYRFPWYLPKRGTTYDEAERSFTAIEGDNVKLLGFYRDAQKAGIPPSPTYAPSPDSAVETPAVNEPPQQEQLDSKILYAPQPVYPFQARESKITGSGRFKIRFNSQGVAQSVQILNSTGNQVLDGASVRALRAWRAAPGTQAIVVPVTYRNP